VSRKDSAIPNNAGQRPPLRILFAVIVVDLIGFGIVVPILPFYVDHYGAAGAELGMVVASFAAMQFLFAPVWGRASDRFGRRPVLLITIAGNAASLLLLGLADSLAAIYAARILGGIFSANIGVATAYVTDATSEQERPRWMGMIGASFAVGFTLGPAIGGVLSLWGYSAPMLFAAGLGAINFAAAWTRLAESPGRAAATPGATEGRLQVLRRPGVAHLTAANFVFGFAVTQLETIFAFYMALRFDYDAIEVAMILVGMAVWMGGIQGGGMKALSARFDERTLMMFGATLLTVGLAGVPLAETVPWLVLPLALAATGRALVHPSLLSLVSYRGSETNRGAVMGTFQSGASLARVIGPFVAGLAFDIDPEFPFTIAALACALVLALALLLPSSARGNNADTAAG
jgi:MFS family permease